MWPIPFDNYKKKKTYQVSQVRQGTKLVSIRINLKQKILNKYFFCKHMEIGRIKAYYFKNFDWWL